MQLMADWYRTLGAALVDGGNPFSAARTVDVSGTRVAAPESTPTGYTILEAADLDHALDVARGCPLIHHGRTIQLLEIFPAMAGASAA
jgi:hypothetical protein